MAEGEAGTNAALRKRRPEPFNAETE